MILAGAAATGSTGSKGDQVLGAGSNGGNLCIMDMASQTTYEVSNLEDEAFHLSYATRCSYSSL
jgi:hypothetical protein